MAGSGEFEATGEHPSVLPEAFFETLRTTGGNPALVRAAHPELVTDFGNPNRELGMAGTDLEAVGTRAVMPDHWAPLRVRGRLGVQPGPDENHDLLLISNTHDRVFTLGTVDAETAAAVRGFGLTPIDAGVVTEKLPFARNSRPGQLARIFGIQEPLPAGGGITRNGIGVVEGTVVEYDSVYDLASTVGRAVLSFDRVETGRTTAWVEVVRPDRTGFGAVVEGLADVHYPPDEPMPFDVPQPGDRVSLLLRGDATDKPKVTAAALLAAGPYREALSRLRHDQLQIGIEALAQEHDPAAAKRAAAAIIEQSAFIYGDGRTACMLTPSQKQQLRETLVQIFADQPAELPIAARLMDPSLEHELNITAILVCRELRRTDTSIFALSSGEYAQMISEAIDRGDAFISTAVDLSRVVLTPEERYEIAEAAWGRCLEDPDLAADWLYRFDRILRDMPAEIRGDIVHRIVASAPSEIVDTLLTNLLNLEVKELADPRRTGLPPTADDLEHWNRCRASLDRIDARTPGNLPDVHARNHLNALAAAYMPYVVPAQQ